MCQRCGAYSDGPLQFRYHSGAILTENSAACDHDQKIRLDRFLRWFHSRQHAAAALGRKVKWLDDTSRVYLLLLRDSTERCWDHPFLTARKSRSASLTRLMFNRGLSTDSITA